MKKQIIIGFLFLLPFAFSGISQTTITLQPGATQGKDAVLHGLASMVNLNFGSNDQLPSGAAIFSGAPGSLRSALDFDLSGIPNGAIINSAQLSLYVWGSGTGFGPHNTLSGSNASWLQRITSNWDENTVTWNSQPATTTINQATIPASTSPSQDYLNIDVTALVQDMIDNPTTSFGFLLRLDTEVHWRLLNFCSSDHADSGKHPKIVITYTMPVASDTCITLQPDGESGQDAILHGLGSLVNMNYCCNGQFPAGACTFSGVPGNVRGVLDFNLSWIPSGTLINSATLSLYAWGASVGFGPHNTLSGSNECWLQRITSNWDENSVTWNNQPPTTTMNQVTLPASTSPTQDYLNINVTALVQDMIDNPTSSFGFLFKLHTESYYRLMNFCSSDHVDNTKHPKIEICYSYAVSVNETVADEIRFNVYPNPARNTVTVELGNDQQEDYSIELINTLGEVMKRITNAKQLETIEIINYPKGVYVIRVTNDNTNRTKLLLIN